VREVLQMTVYTQQANNLMERLPIADQQFAIEFLKKLIRNSNADDITETTINKMPNQKAAVKRFIENINAITDEPLDEEFDEIIKMGITLRTPEELGLI